jgi:hypothetical protein
MPELLTAIMGLAAPVVGLVEVLKKSVLQLLRTRYAWSDEQFAAVVTGVSILLSYGALALVMLSGTAFPLLPTVGFNADIPLLSWLFGGAAVWLFQWGQHQVFLNGLGDLVRLLRSIADVVFAKAEAQAIKNKVAAPK